VITLFLGFFVSLGFLLGPDIYSQANTLQNEIPKTWQTLQAEISVFEWGRELASENPRFRDFFEDETGGTSEDADMTKGIIGYLSTSALVIGGMLMVFVIALFIGAKPELYSQGFIRFFPVHRRKRVLEIMDEISLTIQWWLVGQLASMVILGVFATLGLWLLGVPYALLLGTFTALMTFIPNLGPVIASVPVILIALTVSPWTAIYAGMFYTVLQCLEGYFLTPMIHQRAISAPPVLIITVQFLLYYLLGFLGVFLAMPLLCCAMVIVKRVYIEDILNDSLSERTPYDLEGNTIGG
jgi:predicted PurR-regulated permease PerM